MSFYRSAIVALAAMGLAASVFAADENKADAQNPAAAQQLVQTADASQAAQPAGEQAKVDLNKATAKELMQVKGLSAAKAKAIVAYRKKHGDFKSVDELKDVKGFKKMNEETLKKVQDQLTVG